MGREAWSARSEDEHSLGVSRALQRRRDLSRVPQFPAPRKRESTQLRATRGRRGRPCEARASTGARGATARARGRRTYTPARAPARDARRSNFGRIRPDQRSCYYRRPRSSHASTATLNVQRRTLIENLWSWDPRRRPGPASRSLSSGSAGSIRARVLAYRRVLAGPRRSLHAIDHTSCRRKTIKSMSNGACRKNEFFRARVSL